MEAIWIISFKIGAKTEVRSDDAMHLFLGILLPTSSLTHCATIYPPPVDSLGRSPRGGLCAQVHPGHFTSFGLKKRSVIRFSEFLFTLVATLSFTLPLFPSWNLCNKGGRTNGC